MVRMRGTIAHSGKQGPKFAIVIAISKLLATVSLLGICACASTNRTSLGHPVVREPVVPGTYAVLICNGPRTCSAHDTVGVYADGTIVVLERDISTLADTLRRLYPYSEITDSAFVHVQVCYLFHLHPHVQAREGPDLSGFSDLVISPTRDSVSFSLGESADAGYTANVVMKDGAMTGNAIGWNSQQLFVFDMVNGQRVVRRRTKAELAGKESPVDRLIGSRIGPPNERICLAGGKY
jgi:hypothetical protein